MWIVTVVAVCVRSCDAPYHGLFAGRFTFQYSLDRSSWTSCADSLSLGPLTPGYHVLQVQTRKDAAAGSPAVVSDPVAYQWNVAIVDNATLQVHALPDGPHALEVVAVMPDGVREAFPRVYHWAVDTVPPVTRAVLASPALSNSGVAVVNVSCGNDAMPDACAFCWRTRLNGVISAETCVRSVGGDPAGGTSGGSGDGGGNDGAFIGHIVIPSPPNGVVDAVVVAVDGAGNRAMRPS